MRQRKVKNLSEKLLLKSDLILINPDSKDKRLNNFFKKYGKINLEIGMGKGDFIRKLSEKNPQTGYIGLEKDPSVIYKASVRTKKQDNLIFILSLAERLSVIFGENKVDNIYLTFSDPWPKKRHAKRRLTAKLFLDEYKKILKKDGKIIFKSDSLDLYLFSISSFLENDFIITHKSENFLSETKDLPLTEYEQKFRSLGKNIYYLEVVYGKNEENM